MAIFTWPIPANKLDKIGDDTAEAVTEYLAAQSPPIVAGVTVQADPPALVIEASTTPLPALDAWTAGPSQKQQRIDAADATLKQFHDAIGAAQVPTNAQRDKALSALIERVHLHITGQEP